MKFDILKNPVSVTQYKLITYPYKSLDKMDISFFSLNKWNNETGQICKKPLIIDDEMNECQAFIFIKTLGKVFTFFSSKRTS